MCKHVLLLCSITLAGGFEAKVAIFYIVHYSISECHLICLIYAIACVFCVARCVSFFSNLILTPFFSFLRHPLLVEVFFFPKCIPVEYIRTFSHLLRRCFLPRLLTSHMQKMELNTCVCVCKVHEITLKLVLFYSCWQHSFKLNQMASREYSSPTTIA